MTIPRPLREKLGDEAAESLVELLNQVAERTKGDVVTLVEEKFERRLSEEMSKIRVELAEAKSDLIRWMFLFWVGQLAVMTGLFFTFLRR